MGADTVFISYSHDSVEHSDRVLDFANKLRSMGVDVELDQYHTRPQEGWPQWCEVQLRPENSKFVLLICTKAYHDRVDNNVPADEGRGVYWEGGIINQYIYNNKGGGRFIPVLFGDESSDSVPIRLQNFTEFRVKTFDLDDLGFQALYRELTSQPAVVKPTLGAKIPLKERTPPAPQVAAPLPDKPTLSTSSTFAASPPAVEVPKDAGHPRAMIAGGLTLCVAIAGLTTLSLRSQPGHPPGEPSGMSVPKPSRAATPQVPNSNAPPGAPAWTPLLQVTDLTNLSLKDADVYSSPREAPDLILTVIQPGTSLFLDGELVPIQRATIDGKVWLRAETKSGSEFVVAKSLCQPGPAPCPYDAVRTVTK